MASKKRMVTVGIDLGTTFSTIATIDNYGQAQVLSNAEGGQKTPSVVMFEEGGNEVRIGTVAAGMSVAMPDRVIACARLHIGRNPPCVWEIDGTEYRPEEILALVLKKLTLDAEMTLGGNVEINRAVITVPAYFTEEQRTAIRAAGEMAGLSVVAVVLEPIAAAIASGLDKQGESRIVVVYDLGGTSFDVTVMRVEKGEVRVLAIGGNAELGGKDWDFALVDYLANEYEAEFGEDPRDDPWCFQDLYDAARMARESLSRTAHARVIVQANGHRKIVELSRNDLDSLTRPLLDVTETVLEETLERAKDVDGWKQVDELLLVGGAAKMPQVAEMLRQVTAKDPSIELDPDTAIAEGAALYGFSRELKKASESLTKDESCQERLGVKERASMERSVVCGDKMNRDCEPALPMDRVHFSITSPSIVLAGSPFVLDVWAHLEEQRNTVLQQARQELCDGAIRIKSKGPVRIARGSWLSVHLWLDGLQVQAPEDSIQWEGCIGNATFSVIVPQETPEGPRRGCTTVYLDGLEIAKVHFTIVVGGKLSDIDALPTRERRYRKAFASYASADRDAVLGRVQGMQKVSPDLDIFLDVLSLRSGQDWETELWQRIPTSDVFYLFWSEHAQQSEWVKKEWQCALSMRGADFIDPVPLVPATVAPPPPELAGKHFNDWMLAFLRRQHRETGELPQPRTVT